MNARRIPDPTTAGDFCRRFQPHHVRTLLDVFNEARLKVWAEQPAEFFDEARIEWTARSCRPTASASREWTSITKSVGLPSARGVAGQHERGAEHCQSLGQSTEPRRGAEEFDRALDVCSQAASVACCCAATPTSRKPRISTAGLTTRGCGSSSGPTARRNCVLAEDLPGKQLEGSGATGSLSSADPAPRPTENVKERSSNGASSRTFACAGRGRRVRVPSDGLPKDLPDGRGEKVPGS